MPRCGHDADEDRFDADVGQRRTKRRTGVDAVDHGIDDELPDEGDCCRNEAAKDGQEAVTDSQLPAGCPDQVKSTTGVLQHAAAIGGFLVLFIQAIIIAARRN